jgi:ATP-dependent RNA helicase DeaD
MLFSECWLKAWLLRSLESIGYKEVTPIQAQVLKIALNGKNIVWQSQTWTGKTAAFLLPILNKVDTNKKTLQVLILAPTRELVVQIGEEIRNLTKFYGVSFACLYGWASPLLQKNILKKNPAIVVATPGRLMDFMNQKVINIGVAEYFILDEVDRMLDMWFVRDIKKIRAQLKNVKQTLTFSATMNDEMKAIIKEHISSYEFIKIGEGVTVDKIHHRYVAIDHEQKLYNVIKLIRTHPNDKVLIFTHTKRNTKTIHQILIWDKFKAGLLNGDMAQGKRQSTLNAFKAGETQILVTTDVAARGLNMENVWLVINFDVPADPKSYIHRIGRTGRAGASGKAIMLVSPLEIPLFKEIEKIHKIRILSSEHTVLQDKEWSYGNLRLDRSTDKKWGKRPQAPKRQSFTKTYSKIYPSDEQKAMRTENNYRSNPNHKQYERRPSRPGTPAVAGDRGVDTRPSTGWYKGRKPDSRSSSPGYQWRRPDTRSSWSGTKSSSSQGWYRGMGSSKHR